MKLTDEQSKLYHSHTIRNMEEIQRSQKCGCLACCKVFSPDIVEDAIRETEGNEYTSLCPYCNCDALIGDASGMEISVEILKALNKRWF